MFFEFLKMPMGMKDNLRTTLLHYQNILDLAASKPFNPHGPPLNSEKISSLDPIFVLSTGRCGTKWLTKVLGASNQIMIRHEPSPRLFRQSVRSYEGGLDRSQEFVEIIRSARDDILAAASRANVIYMETNNRLSFLAPAIAEAYPSSRFIHLYRHPADFVRSAVRRNYYNGSTFDGSRISNRDSAAWDEMPQLAKTSWLWNETNQFILDFMDSLPAKRKLSVQSEHMWSSSQVTKDIAQFIGITDVAASKIERLQSKQVNRQKSGAFSTYEGWSAEHKAILLEWCPLAEQFGYNLHL